MTSLKPRAGLQLTIEEFLELPDTDDRRKMELDRGELYIMPRPRRVHQAWHLEIGWHIQNHLKDLTTLQRNCSRTLSSPYR